MTRLGGFGVPGMGASDSISRRELLWGGDDSYHAALWKGGVISGAARDAGNTPTSVLRAGLVLGQLTSGGEHAEFNYDLTDGSQNVAGVLDHELRMTDFDANNADRVTRVLVRGPVKASMLLIEGSAFVGHAAEFIARRQMVGAGFIFDDDPFGYKAGLGARMTAKTADYTVLDSDNGTIFTNSGAAGAVIFTLPATAKRGLEFTFNVVADQSVTVTAGTADTLIAFNDLAADSIAFSTAAEKIGGTIRIVGDGSKWIAQVGLGAETQTPTIAT